MNTHTVSHFTTTTLAAAHRRTPYLLVDTDEVASNYYALQSALKNVQFFYAVKANPDRRILATLAKCGAQFDIASANEMKLLLALGIDPERMLYSNPVKPWQDMQAAHQSGVRRFAFDSPAEITKLSLYAPGAEVVARLRVSDKDSVFPFANKFGVAPHEAIELLTEAKDAGLIPYGLSFHVGSQSQHPERWSMAISQAANVMETLQEQGITLKVLDIGGGYPAAYTEGTAQIAEIGEVVADAVAALPYKVDLFAEPGRFLVASAGMLVTTVIGKADRDGETWLYLDTSAFHGMMETLLSAYTLQYPLITTATSEDLTPMTLTGPTCDSQDTMMYKILLPRNITIGDRIGVLLAGAYTTAYASWFNGFPPPTVYYTSQHPRRNT